MRLEEGWLGRVVNVVVDRPIGSRHPKFPETIYPVNYGYVPNTKAADGEEVDAYIFGVGVPLQEFTGEVVAVIRRLDDEEDKLVVARPGTIVAEAAVKQAVLFQERWFRHVIHLSRTPPHP